MKSLAQTNPNTIFFRRGWALLVALVISSAWTLWPVNRGGTIYAALIKGGSLSWPVILLALSVPILLLLVLLPWIFRNATMRFGNHTDSNKRPVPTDLPDRLKREEILKTASCGWDLAPDVNLALIARITTGLNGADLQDLCTQAARAAGCQGRQQVRMADIEEALDRLLLGTPSALVLDDHERQVAASHEAGHALAAWRIPQAEPFQEISLLQPDLTMDTVRLPSWDETINYSHVRLMARLTVMLAGRAAEEITFGNQNLPFSERAGTDLVEAKRLARQMIVRWGMWELGLKGAGSSQGSNSPAGEVNQQMDQVIQGQSESQAIERLIDQLVEGMLAERYQVVYALLVEEHENLERLANTLLQDETIDLHKMAQLLGERPVDSEKPIQSLS